MFKKIFSYPVFLFLFITLIGLMGFGSIIKYHYEGGKKYQFFQKPVILISSIPLAIKEMIRHRSINLYDIENALPKLEKHKTKNRFKKFINSNRNGLLILPRYEHTLSRAVVDIIDLNDFQIIHTYKHEIDKMNEKVVNSNEFPRLKIDNSPMRFLYQHPIILNDGSLISIYGPAYKIDFCSNLIWINDEEIFHHSQEIDHEGNIWVGGQMNPKSKIVKENSLKGYADDSIIKINTKGKILFNKSVTEILIENNVVDKNILNSGNDPIHLNDIEPALKNTKFWKKGDLFLSPRNQSAILHYRPSTNKIINFIKGPFSQQHDVDIISDEEISIFNNNNFFSNNEYSEVVIYNFKTKEFSTLFNKQLQKFNFKTETNGLSQILNDGSLMVEEQNHGRILLFNNLGKIEWEFVNKDKNGDIGHIKWSRIIEDEGFINKFKLLVGNNKCID